MSETQAEVEAEKNAPLRRVRFITAIVMLAGFILVVVFLYRDCATTSSFTSTNERSVEVLCQTPDVSSGPLLLAVLLVLLLLWPDISELSVLGVTMKRRVAEARQAAASAEQQADAATERASRAESEVSAIKLDMRQLNTLVASVTTNNAQSVNVNVDTNQWTDGKDARLETAYSKVTGSNSGAPVLNDDRTYPDLAIELLRRYERFSERLGLKGRRPVGRSTGMRPYVADLRSSFISDFEDQLAVVRDVRNAIAHGQDVPKASVAEALTIIVYLDDNFRSWLEQHGVTGENER